MDTGPLRVVKGSPTPAELAALVVVLAARSSARQDHVQGSAASGWRAAYDGRAGRWHGPSSWSPGGQTWRQTFVYTITGRGN